MTEKLLTGAWWVLLIRGIVALIFGIFALANVGATALVLFFWFVVFTIADGIFNVIMALTQRKELKNWWLPLLYGLGGILIGVVAVSWPQLTALVLIYFIAIRALIGGVSEVILVVRGHQELRGEWLLILGGVLSIIVGILLFLQPVAIGLALLWVIGCWAIAMGIILIVSAFRSRGRGMAVAT